MAWTPDLNRVREALEANLLGAWRLCEAFIPLMRRHGYGRIVNISSSMGALNDMGVSPAYRVSKTALNALTRILASKLRGRSVPRQVRFSWTGAHRHGRLQRRAVGRGGC